MDYLKIGKLLKKEREQKGLSHYQVFEMTRIQPSILKSIEEGQPEVSDVFFKSFIKTYAQLLGLDFDTIIQTSKTEKSSQKNEKDKKTEKQDRVQPAKPVFWFVLAVIIFIIILNFKFFLNKLPYLNEDAEQNKQGKIKKEMDLRNSASKLFDEGSSSSYQTGKAKDSISNSERLTENVKSRVKSFPKNDIESQNPWGFVQSSVFKHEILIRSFFPLKIYFKLDQQSTITKELLPSLWFVIKAKESIYIRFDEKVDQTEIFYNGRQWQFDSNDFFEKTFQ